MRVDRATMTDVEQLDMIEDGGSITYDDLSAIKVSGSLPYIHMPDIGNDYIRVYSAHEQGGKVEEILHGTFTTATPTSTYSHKTRRGELDMYSLLQITQDAGITEPLTIPAGTVAVSRASQYLTSLGLAVRADVSATQVTTNPTYDAGTSYLEIINDLLAIAGFNSAGVDPSGAVILTAYTDPSTRAPSVVLRDDEEGCLFAPAVSHEFNLYEVPNVLIAVASSTDINLVSVAKNNDPTSIYSTVSRGREIVLKEDASDITEQGVLDALAQRRLTEVSSAVESIEFSHPFLPYECGEAIQLRYTESGLDFTGVAVKKELKLTPAIMCQTRIRRFVRM